MDACGALVGVRHEDRARGAQGGREGRPRRRFPAPDGHSARPPPCARCRSPRRPAPARLPASSVSCRAVRISTSQASPPSNRSRTAPTALNEPSTTVPVCVLNAASRSPTSPLAAPALSTRSVMPALPSVRRTPRPRGRADKGIRRTRTPSAAETALAMARGRRTHRAFPGPHGRGGGRAGCARRTAGTSEKVRIG